MKRNILLLGFSLALLLLLCTNQTSSTNVDEAQTFLASVKFLLDACDPSYGIISHLPRYYIFKLMLCFDEHTFNQLDTTWLHKLLIQVCPSKLKQDDIVYVKNNYREAIKKERLTSSTLDQPLINEFYRMYQDFTKQQQDLKLEEKVKLQVILWCIAVEPMAKDYTIAISHIDQALKKLYSEQLNSNFNDDMRKTIIRVMKFSEHFEECEKHNDMANKLAQFLKVLKLGEYTLSTAIIDGEEKKPNFRVTNTDMPKAMRVLYERDPKISQIPKAQLINSFVAHFKQYLDNAQVMKNDLFKYQRRLEFILVIARRMKGHSDMLKDKELSKVKIQPTKLVVAVGDVPSSSKPDPPASSAIVPSAPDPVKPPVPVPTDPQVPSPVKPQVPGPTDPQVPGPKANPPSSAAGDSDTSDSESEATGQENNSNEPPVQPPEQPPVVTHDQTTNSNANSVPSNLDKNKNGTLNQTSNYLDLLHQNLYKYRYWYIGSVAGLTLFSLSAASFLGQGTSASEHTLTRRAFTLSPEPGSFDKTILIVGVVPLLAVAVALYCWCIRRKNNNEEEGDEQNTQQTSIAGSNVSSNASSSNVFTSPSKVKRMVSSSNSSESIHSKVSKMSKNVHKKQQKTKTSITKATSKVKAPQAEKKKWLMQVNPYAPSSVKQSAISKATISKATISKATISKATISKATISKATISKATISKATISKTKK